MIGTKRPFLLVLSAVGMLVFHTSGNPTRLDIYDSYDNHLMFITFEYEGGRNTRRTVYMADSTFIRMVIINYNADGTRLNEVSYDFNNDTSFVTSYRYNGDLTSFSIVDQFRVDHVGGLVSYNDGVGNLNFTLQYNETGGQAAVVSYVLSDGAQQLERVEITDPASGEKYFGLFSTTGTRDQTNRKASACKTASLTKRGFSMVDLRINLRSAGNVCCEVMTLSGRRVRELFNGKLSSGFHTKQFRIDGGAVGAVSNGMYLLVVSVDGVNVLQQRWLHQHATALHGGVR